MSHIRSLLLAFWLLLESRSDLKTLTVPSWYPLGMMLCLLPFFKTGEPWRGLLVLLLLGLLFLLVEKLSKETLGPADEKLCMAAGMLLGVKAVLFGMALGAGLALLLEGSKKSGKGEAFPFVPYLSLGIWTSYLFIWS